MSVIMGPQRPPFAPSVNPTGGKQKAPHQPDAALFQCKRLHSAIGYVTPHEAGEDFYANLNAVEKAA
ncbi:hypothetical protein GCM10011363_46600 [Marivita lacus]|uniref:Transposase n=1 Tax=Marivita lacus TaxID=1323742 RepID=A0ABQ1LJY1_9RHOB|nr:hypothetical protein [Marivita lacus]GGC24868.1 hypothetical protein GCM10011363_46600 [Marivita lacus]